MVFRKQIEAVKNAVRIEEIAAAYGDFRLSGSGRLVGRCVDPNHHDRTTSMTIYPDEQRFYCFGCEEHGDVLDLVVLAEGGEVWTAMHSLAQRYGVELPERPPSWYARQRRQEPVRDAIEEAKIAHMQRRVFRRFKPLLETMEDADERHKEIEHLWEAAGEIAVLIWAGRRNA